MRKLVAAVTLAVSLAVHAHGAASGVPVILAEQQLLPAAGRTDIPVSVQTQIPATTASAGGPGGAPAVSVTVPTIDRDERACVFTIDLPPVDESYGALSVWVRGTAVTKRLELVIETDTGSFITDFPLEPDWRRMIIGPHNVRPRTAADAGDLSVRRAKRLRLAFGAWQGLRGGPHEVGIGPICALQSPLFGPPCPVTEIGSPRAAAPLQPFTVELLDIARGEWLFREALGERLSLDGPVHACAYGSDAGPVRLGYLCCDPEFPDDPAHGGLRVVEAVDAAEGALWFRIQEPYFACGVVLKPRGDGTWECSLHNIAPGPSRQGDPYVAGMYLLAGDDTSPLWLLDRPPGDSCLRLTTDRVGHVFTDSEPLALELAIHGASHRQSRAFAVEVIDYATRDRLWAGRVSLQCRPGRVNRRTIELPMQRFGVFEVTASDGDGTSTRLRVCRIPTPKQIAPEASSIGMNVFQQQVWWYAHQVPLMAAAGVHWVRPWLKWENTWSMQEPEPGEFDTRALDAALRRMELHGQRYEYILFGAPHWVAGGQRAGVPPENKLDLWGQWVERVVGRYRGRIGHYEVWNEPDLMWPDDTRASGEHYLAMLRATWDAAKRADPDCVIHGLSHSGNEQWLDNVGRQDPGRSMDLATLHVYSPPADLSAQLARRRAVLARHGMADMPVWVNEFGAPACDFSPGYSARCNCSELSQAVTLTADYAQILAFAPDSKAFWFCSYDPRDPTTQSQWTWDAGVGILYLGFLPKLSYAALAGVAQMLDGRHCLGQVRPAPGLHQVSFEGDVAVVWCDAPQDDGPVPAVAFGCLSEEMITLRDMFTNVVQTARADQASIRPSAGAFYIEGSRQLSALARVESATGVQPETVSVQPGAEATVDISAPSGARLRVGVPEGLPVTAQVERVGENALLVLRAQECTPRLSAPVSIELNCPTGAGGLLAPHTASRTLDVTIGAPNMIRDGSFLAGNLLEWDAERSSPYSWDATVGHTSPGSLRLDGPLDRRLVHRRIEPRPGRPLHVSMWVRTEALSRCLVTLNLSLSAPDRWLGTWCLAHGGDVGAPEDPLIPGAGRIPTATTDWTQVEMRVDASSIPPDTSRASLYVDVAGGTGRIWFDDFDLWQD
ncbi:MAG TPA: hypothetical protein DGT21_11365 [Armatimonadetes bacterium]|nr:hypothetical protein [Armatimonadota bacterium]